MRLDGLVRLVLEENEIKIEGGEQLREGQGGGNAGAQRTISIDSPRITTRFWSATERGFVRRK